MSPAILAIVFATACLLAAMYAHILKISRSLTDLRKHLEEREDEIDLNISRLNVAAQYLLDNANPPPPYPTQLPLHPLFDQAEFVIDPNFIHKHDNIVFLNYKLKDTSPPHH